MSEDDDFEYQPIAPKATIHRTFVSLEDYEAATARITALEAALREIVDVCENQNNRAHFRLAVTVDLASMALARTARSAT